MFAAAPVQAPRSNQKDIQELYQRIQDEKQLIDIIGSLLENGFSAKKDINSELMKYSVNYFKQIIKSREMDSIFELDEPPAWIDTLIHDKEWAKVMLELAITNNESRFIECCYRMIFKAHPDLIENLIQDREWAKIMIQIANVHHNSELFVFCFNKLIKIHPDLIETIPPNTLSEQEFDNLLTETITSDEFKQGKLDKFLKVIVTDDLTIVKTAMIVSSMQCTPIVLNIYKHLKRDTKTRNKANLFIRFILSKEHCDPELCNFITNKQVSIEKCHLYIDLIRQINKESQPVTFALAFKVFNTSVLKNVEAVKKCCLIEDPSFNNFEKIDEIVKAIERAYFNDCYRDVVDFCKFRFFSVALLKWFRKHDLKARELVIVSRCSLEERVFVEMGLKHPDLHRQIMCLVGKLLNMELKNRDHYKYLFTVCRNFMALRKYPDPLDLLRLAHPSCPREPKENMLRWLEEFTSPFSVVYIKKIVDLLTSENFAKFFFTAGSGSLRRIQVWRDQVAKTPNLDPSVLAPLNAMLSRPSVY